MLLTETAGRMPSGRHTQNGRPVEETPFSRSGNDPSIRVGCGSNHCSNSRVPTVNRCWVPAVNSLSAHTRITRTGSTIANEICVVQQIDDFVFF